MKDRAERLLHWVAQASTTHPFALIMLFLLTLQIQWGLWDSLDWPTIDESWALLDGVQLAGGQVTSFPLWKAPLHRLLYAATYTIVCSVPATFYAQRLVLTILSVFALYWLLCHFLPRSLAWAGAAWWAVSPFLVDLTWDRTDFLVAALCAWVAVGLMATKKMRFMIVGGLVALMSVGFRPEYLVFLVMYALAWIVPEIYSRFPFSTFRRIFVLTAGLTGVFITGLAMGIGLFTQPANIAANAATPTGNLIWVFAHNRHIFNSFEKEPNDNRSATYEPFWAHFERDYGSDHSLRALLTHPDSLFKDITRYSVALFTFIKRFTTNTVWASVAIRAERWLFGLIVLVGVSSYFFWIDWRSYWQSFFGQASRSWIGLIAILSMIGVLLIVGPFPVYSLVLVPAIIAPLLILLLPILKRLIRHPRETTALLMIGSVILAPNARAFVGKQPVRHLATYFGQIPRESKVLRVLGNESITICPYVFTAEQPCIGQLWDDWYDYKSLPDYTRLQHYDYLIIDDSMTYALTPPFGLGAVYAGQDPHWQLVFEVADYRVYKNIP